MIQGRAAADAGAETPALRRITETKPGYDCIAKPCGERGCGTRPGASHGRHGDEWHYIVTDGAFAISLAVFTSWLDGKRMPVGQALASHYPAGADLSAHSTRPSEEQVRDGSPGNACSYLDGGRCFVVWTSASAADTFVKENGLADEREQGDAFWRALEVKWAEIRDLVREEPAVVRCERCNGRGVVPQ